MTTRQQLAVLLLSCLSCVAWAQSITVYRTYHRFGYFTPPASLDYHLWTNWTARTNGTTPGAARLLSSAGHVGNQTATNALWNTNWYFFACDNATAQTHVRTNAGEAWYAKKSTLISRVLMLQSGHNNCGEAASGSCGTNQWYLAIDRTNGQHWRRVVYAISRQNGAHGDYYLAAVHEPWPTNLGTMKILLASVYTNKLFGAAPRLYNSQFSRTEASAGVAIPGNFLSLVTPVGAYAANGYAGDNVSLTFTNTTSTNTYTATNALGFSIGGDSGSPTFIVVSNRLVLISAGISAPGISSQALFLEDVAAVTAAAGYSTNDYPVDFETLGGFPDR